MTCIKLVYNLIICLFIIFFLYCFLVLQWFAEILRTVGLQCCWLRLHHLYRKFRWPRLGSSGCNFKEWQLKMPFVCPVLLRGLPYWRGIQFERIFIIPVILFCSHKLSEKKCVVRSQLELETLTFFYHWYLPSRERGGSTIG